MNVCRQDLDAPGKRKTVVERTKDLIICSDDLKNIPTMATRRPEPPYISIQRATADSFSHLNTSPDGVSINHLGEYVSTGPLLHNSEKEPALFRPTPCPLKPGGSSKRNHGSWRGNIFVRVARALRIP